jgi:hypothetical protein
LNNNVKCALKKEIFLSNRLGFCAKVISLFRIFVKVIGGLSLAIEREKEDA